MGSDVEHIKQELEDENLESVCWLQDENMLADILTKDKRDKFGLEELIINNEMKVIENLNNRVMYRDGDYVIEGRKLRDKIVAVSKPPKRRKMKSSE